MSARTLGALGAILAVSLWATGARAAAQPADGKNAQAAKPDSKEPKSAEAKDAAAKPGEPKAQEAPKPARPEEFEEALALHHRGASRDAAPRFYAYLRGSARTADNYEWAQFFLADDLWRLGFSHAAVVYWADVAKTRSRAEILPEALAKLEEVTTQTAYDEELVEREVLFGTDFGFIPPSALDYVQFHKGMAAYKTGNLRWAWNHFDKLHPGTAYAARAKLVHAVHKMTQKNDVEGALADFEALAKEPSAPREVRNEAKISAARLYFERGEYERAHQGYDSVDLPELDPGRGQLYLEKAWTFYRRGDASRAMGLLLALDAPSFRELFLPEKYILASLIYKDRCHYLPAKRAVRGYIRRFKRALTLIHERGNLKEDPRLFKAALEQDDRARRAEQFVDLLQRERDLIDQLASRFDKSGLTRALRQIYDRELAEATRQREVLLKSSLEAAADRLLRGEEQVRLLEYEIGLDFFKRVKKGLASSASAVRDEPVLPAEIAYVFDGEYWNDELKDYRLFLPSRCAAVEADR
jgi:hypothetical protein